MKSSRALGLLSDGAFKLYIHLCLNADRSTGLLSAEHGDLVKALGKSRRSIVTYLEELRQPRCLPDTGRCQPALRWSRSRSAMGSGRTRRCGHRQRPITVAGYIEQTRRLLGARRCVGSAFTPADERLAAALFERKVLD